MKQIKGSKVIAKSDRSPSRFTLKVIRKSEEEFKAGKIYKFSLPQEAVEFIDNIINGDDII